MKNIFRSLSTLAIFALLFSACEKVDDLPVYTEGTDNTLSSSKTTVTLTAGDINNDAISFSWTDPNFATDSTNVKYVLEFAPAGTNFADSKSITVTSVRTVSVSGVTLNNMLIGWGVAFGDSKELDVRLHSSYVNNNDLKSSNTIKVTATPVGLPFVLTTSSNGPIAATIATKDDVGATFSWVKPAYDYSITYTIEYDSTGKNFSNVHTIAGGDNIVSKDITKGTFNAAAKTVGIATGVTGSVDFRIKATIATTNQVSYSNAVSVQVTPADLIIFMYMPGDYQGWSPEVAPKIASSDGVNFEGYVNVPAGGSGEFKITSAPDWSHTNYGGNATTLSTSGGNLVWPNGTGTYYKVNVNLSTLAWSATQITTWGVIGDATPGGWDNSTALTYDVSAKVWKATVTFGSGQFKFRANNGWDINLGGSASGLNYGGDNIPAPSAGPHVVTLDLNNPPNYTYTIN